MLVRIDDEDIIDDDLIDHITFDRTMTPNNIWSGAITGNSFYDVATFQAEFRVACATNFYGSDCTIMCVPRDDSTGHYSCSDTGQKVCLDGYTDPSTCCVTGIYVQVTSITVNVDTSTIFLAICAAGCNTDNAYCDEPGECM